MGPRRVIGLSWRDNMLSVSRTDLPAAIDINYLEAFCRSGAHERDWGENVISHETTLLSGGQSGLSLESRLADGVVVSHVITATDEEVDFRLTARKPTANESEAHWAQPCIRVGPFTGFEHAADPYDYIRNCFVFLAGDVAHMPTEPWATSARYTPGQVWCPPHVPREDVNPRPLSSQVPSNGLIGCVSADGKAILATAWEPYHDLFQGVIQCIHSDFRIGGLVPGQSVEIRGKLYLVPADVAALVERYEADFPEQLKT